MFDSTEFQKSVIGKGKTVVTSKITLHKQNLMLTLNNTQNIPVVQKSTKHTASDNYLSNIKW